MIIVFELWRKKQTNIKHYKRLLWDFRWWCCLCWSKYV